MAWLSTLIDTMEKFSRPEFRATPCDPGLLAAVAGHLARPAMPHGFTARISACETKSRDHPDTSTCYSPAICSRGRLPRSTPRSRASSRPM